MTRHRAWAIGLSLALGSAGVGIIIFVTRFVDRTLSSIGGSRSAQETGSQDAAPTRALTAPALQGNAGEAPMATPPAPPRISSRRHRGRVGPKDLGGAQLEAMGSQLMTELERLRPEIETCLRGVPTSAIGTASDPAAVIRALEEAGLLHGKGALDPEQEALLLDFEAAATSRKPTPAQRTLVLEIEPRDGEVRIIGILPGTNASPEDPYVTCAQQGLTGKVLPIPAAKAGRRTSLTFPLRSPSGESSAALDSLSESAPTQDSQ
jgi:hypothetical protein